MAKTSVHKTTTRERGPALRAMPARAGGIAVRAATPAARAAPVGGASGGSLMGLAADASGQLENIAPTFGNVLSSIGLGVANSQTALDKGVVDTVNKLADTKITVVTEVVEQLDDDGLPDPAATQLVTNDLSVLNFVTPTVHEWKHVALSMDMSVGAMDDETGMSFSVDSYRSSYGVAGLFWGWVGVGYMSQDESYTSMMSSSHREAQWSSGVVQLDAILAPRRMTKFPVPASVSIGPQIYVSQGSLVETKVAGVVTERSIDVLVSVRKANGAVNPSKVIELDAGGLLPSFASTGAFTGSTTNADGQCKVTLRRTIVPGYAQPGRRLVTVRLGQLSKRFEVVI